MKVGDPESHKVREVLVDGVLSTMTVALDTEEGWVEELVPREEMKDDEWDGVSWPTRRREGKVEVVFFTEAEIAERQVEDARIIADLGAKITRTD
jgi:hypothetical protein